jgi:hypothetical protein
MAIIENNPAGIVQAFHMLGFPLGVTVKVPDLKLDSYRGFTWSLIPHHRVGMVLYSVPPMESIADLPWESWYLDAGRTIHHIHYATRQHADDFEWIQVDATDERPPEVIGRQWYWFDDPDMTLVLSRCKT